MTNPKIGNTLLNLFLTASMTLQCWILSEIVSMKQKIAVIIFKLGLVLTLVIGTGCASLGNGDIDAAPIVKIAAMNGTYLVLKKHPEYRPGFELALAELKTLEQAEKIDFAQVMSIVHRLPVEKLESPEATLIIANATLLLEETTGTFELEKTRPIVTALRQGLELGLR